MCVLAVSVCKEQHFADAHTLLRKQHTQNYHKMHMTRDVSHAAVVVGGGLFGKIEKELNTCASANAAADDAVAENVIGA